jgi:flagellar biosynthesis component FlhA
MAFYSTEVLTSKPDTDRARKAEENPYYGVMAPGSRHVRAKAAYTPSASGAFCQMINLMSGCAHGEVRRGVSVKAAMEIEQRYGVPVPARLILG